jgi:hypothetical protein
MARAGHPIDHITDDELVQLSEQIPDILVAQTVH